MIVVDERETEQVESPTSAGDSGETAGEVLPDDPMPVDDDIVEGEVPNPTYPTYEEVAAWVQDILDAAPDVSRLASVPTSDEVGQIVADALDGSGESVVLPDSLTVTLTTEQFETLRGDAATNFVGVVSCVGMLALILGALVATAVTLHWRGR